jgi:hypothetical protein
MRRFARRRLAYALAGVLAAAGLVVIPAGPAHAAVACEVTYTRTWDNGSGFGPASPSATPAIRSPGGG